MATTRLSDVIVPDVFAGYMAVNTTEKTALFEAGILQNNADISTLLNGGGRTIEMPFWKDLSDTESDTASDDPAEFATPDKLSAASDVARRQIRTHAWSTAVLTGILAGSDPMKRIEEASNRYWQRQFQAIFVATLTGVFADNIANDSGDMVYDIGTDDADAATADELISAEAVINAEHTMGDMANTLTVMVVHSDIYKRLRIQNLIDTIPDAEGKVTFDSYLGKRLIVDDGVRKVVGTNRTEYWSYLAGPGAVGWGESPPPDAVEMDREPLAGRGMGVDTLITRRQFIMHPIGIKWTDTSVSGQFPQNADLALAANWDRVYVERNQINLAALVTNG